MLFRHPPTDLGGHAEESGAQQDEGRRLRSRTRAIAFSSDEIPVNGFVAVRGKVNEIISAGIEDSTAVIEDRRHAVHRNGDGANIGSAECRQIGSSNMCRSISRGKIIATPDCARGKSKIWTRHEVVGVAAVKVVLEDLIDD